MSTRALLVRAVVWSLLLVWAVWKMRTTADVAEGAEMMLAPELRVLAPTGPAVIAGTDPAQVLAALAQVQSAPCGARGAELTVFVHTGLERAELYGQVPDPVADCVRTAVWLQPWPTLPLQMQSSTSW